MKNIYEIIVGNIGSVHVGNNKKIAMREFKEYIEYVNSSVRNYKEPVYFFSNGELEKEYDQKYDLDDYPIE